MGRRGHEVPSLGPWHGLPCQGSPLGSAQKGRAAHFWGSPCSTRLGPGSSICFYDARMKPVLILQNMASDDPAYLGTWLRQRGVAIDLRNAALGDAFPGDLKGHSAMAILGGAQSANDDLPELRQAENLIRQALAHNVPTLGHCLGGQLMARALGARIGPSPAPEVGWQRLQVADSPLAREWFGPGMPAAAQEAVVFHWHYEAFDLPTLPASSWPSSGADHSVVSLASSPACPHQAFAIGPHLALQFHVEMDEPKLLRWSRENDDPLHPPALAAHPQSVQSPQAMKEQAALHLAAQQRLADALYARWLSAAV
jgi:GMP synthase (glutamine-hydrolysing)